MSVSVPLNGVAYTIPATGETGWGSSVTSFIQAVGSSTLQKSGGTFTLTADVDFGASFGLKATYFKTRTASPATSGLFRLARTDRVTWLNQAGGANLPLGPGSDNLLEFNSIDLADVSTAQTFTNKTLTSPTITGGTISATAVISSESWATMSLVNSWVSLGGSSNTPAYRKRPDGRVELRGAVQSGATATSTITTLPSGYRPTELLYFPTNSNGRVVFVSITTAGVVAPAVSATENPDTAQVYLSQISFPTT